MQVISNINLG